jgi:hypothetical protein
MYVHSTTLCLLTVQVYPSDAKLWCALGDITQQDEHYAKAWEVSNHRSSRAQRSIGRYGVMHMAALSSCVIAVAQRHCSVLLCLGWRVLLFCMQRPVCGVAELQSAVYRTHDACVCT